MLEPYIFQCQNPDGSNVQDDRREPGETAFNDVGGSLQGLSRLCRRGHQDDRASSARREDSTAPLHLHERGARRAGPDQEAVLDGGLLPDARTLIFIIPCTVPPRWHPALDSTGPWKPRRIPTSRPAPTQFPPPFSHSFPPLLPYLTKITN